MLSLLRRLISPTNPLRLAWLRASEAFFALVYRYPARHLTVIGVTGTNGKTTTANLAYQVLTAAGHSTALATTVNFALGKKQWENTTKKTTLGRGGVNRFLRQAVRAGCTHAVLEVSSHALMQGRVSGVRFDAAILTNITADHLDFHGSMDEYAAAKAILFGKLAPDSRRAEKYAVLPHAQKYLPIFREAARDAAILTYGLKNGDLTAKNISIRGSRQSFTVSGWQRDFTVTTALLGQFNVLNILGTLGALLPLGIPVRAAVTALRQMQPIPGRLEPIEAGQAYRVLVDFAHSPDAVEQLLRTCRAITPGRVILVYGAAGDRTPEIRREMGQVGDRLADEIYVTTDDPYDTDPVEIIRDVASGIRREAGNSLTLELERERAIRAALQSARRGDTVVIAGKGNQTYQYWERGRKIPWDDRAVCHRLIKKLTRKKRTTPKQKANKKAVRR